MPNYLGGAPVKVSTQWGGKDGKYRILMEYGDGTSEAFEALTVEAALHEAADRYTQKVS